MNYLDFFDETPISDCILSFSYRDTCVAAVDTLHIDVDADPAEKNQLNRSYFSLVFFLIFLNYSDQPKMPHLGHIHQQNLRFPGFHSMCSFLRYLH